MADDIETDLSSIDTVGEAARLFVEVYGADAAWWRAALLADRAHQAMDYDNQLFWSMVIDEIRAYLRRSYAPASAGRRWGNVAAVPEMVPEMLFGGELAPQGLPELHVGKTAAEGASDLGLPDNDQTFAARYV